MRKRSESSPLDVLTWPVRLTLTGLVAERIVRAFWPLWSLLLLVWAAFASGVLEGASVELSWFALITAIGLGGYSLWYAARRFRIPTRADALDRLDRSMPGRPIQAAQDDQAIGSGDHASEAVWRAHIARMQARLSEAEPVPGDLRLSQRDPYGLRYIALLLFVITAGFGTALRGVDGDAAGLGAAEAAIAGPSWEAWIEPPAYTGKPSLYLNEVDRAAFEVPKGSLLTVRLYGKLGALSVEETLSGTERLETEEPQVAISRDITQSGELRIVGDEGAAWQITVIDDARPEVEFGDEIVRRVSGDMEVAFTARDDYGVERGTLTISLDMPNVDRRYGLVVDPEPRDTIILDLPMPIRGGREEFDELLIENLAEHPWAGLPVRMALEVEDASDQASELAVQEVDMPGRRFFQPIAKAVVEQRRDLLWSRENAPRISQILRTVTHRPEGHFPSEQAYLMLRMAITRLDIHGEYGMSDEKQDEIADLLWRTAVMLEEGRLSNALEKLRRAQERLSEAMEQGATDEEIAELMDELREAMREYMEQLAQEAENGENQQAQNQENMQEMTAQDLQDMMDQIQELMEQGRMAEAQQLLNQLMEMMQNMQVARNQGQQGQQGEGQQAMEGLAETLREQQGLSDEAFRDLQEQFNPGAQAGESQQNEGRSGGQGRGQSHEGGQGGESQQNQGEGNGENQQADGQGGQEPGSLADRQQALREELERQQRNLPGAGTPEGDAAREALDRAGEAMERAEDALRDDRTADALGAQSDAMEALREGMRNLGEALAQQQQQNGQRGQQTGQNRQTRDPLGRENGSNGMIGTDENMLQGEDARQRSQELLDEIRRRSGEQNRPQVERDYLKRLLDRF